MSLRSIRQPGSSNRKLPLDALIMMGVGLLFGMGGKFLSQNPTAVPSWVTSYGIGEMFQGKEFWMIVLIIVDIQFKSMGRAAAGAFGYTGGLVLSYVVYRYVFHGLFTSQEILFWLMMLVVAPFAGALCWLSQGQGDEALWIGAFLIAVMFVWSVNMGAWYLHVNDWKGVMLTGVGAILMFRDTNQMARLIFLALLMSVAVRDFGLPLWQTLANTIYH